MEIKSGLSTTSAIPSNTVDCIEVKDEDGVLNSVKTLLAAERKAHEDEVQGLKAELTQTEQVLKANIKGLEEKMDKLLTLLGRNAVTA
eukprot:COSAG05_NODE_2477_length_3012_cov_3.153793_3_plen_88_part_00